ncbi:MAG: hypothetical protein FJ276_15965, partial [Planctomycetes bacterium]|nr:hypothetical protein [Planctomycetota bacterium]
MLGRPIPPAICSMTPACPPRRSGRMIGRFQRRGNNQQQPERGKGIVNKRNLRVNWLLASLLIGSAGSSAQSELPALKPQVRFIPAPLAPSATPPEGPSVLVGFSPFYVSQGGLQDATAIYEPVREGGFRICGSTRRLNRPIIHGQNRVWTGDVPVFRMDTYRDSIPLWVSQETVKPLAVKTHSFGTLRLGVATGDGKTTWLDTLPGTTTATFLPGYTDYQVAAAKGEWKATIRVAVASGMHGLICRVEFDRPMPLVWQYGDVFLTEAKPPSTEVTVAGTEARFVTPDLPNGLVLAGWDGEGTGQKTQEGRFAQFASGKPRRIYHVVAAWGVNRFDAAVAERAHKNLLSTPAAKAWPEEAERLWQAWLDCFVTPALKPEEHFRSLLAAPAEALDRSVSVWTARREEFQIRTPDEHLDALMNWSRAVSEYHRQGPGLFLGTHAYCLYGHISVGWYGKQWAGDHATVEQVLRLYAAGQGEDGKPRDNFFFGNQIRSGDGGWISWVGWNLGHWLSEDNTPHWVNQVWQHYRWTGDRVFVRDLWPVIEKAVAWECQQHDADGDGLFISYYPYWNCDSWACLAKSACATTVGWAMLDAAAHLAEVASQPQAAAKYRALADKTRTAANRELWNEQAGLLTSVGSDGLRYSHPYSWEVALAVNLGLVEWQRGRRAMRWVESH